MSESVNFTIALDREALRRAKIIAARHDTSVNAIVRSYLERLESIGLGDDAGASGNAAILFRYSMGLIPRLQAMRALGVSDYGLLIRMMGGVGLPLPSVSTETERKMVADFVAIVRASEGA